ncbi:MAG: hypothetical protein IIB00_08555 [candidate division Zixibacteria bacterium]|nr:hypothetical protein [candidate division Zixibacteria bacterium]
MKKLRRELTFALINSLIWSLRAANRKLARQIGAFMGIIWIHLSRRDRFLSSRNLKIAYGDTLSSRGAERIARESFLNSGLFLADIIRMKDSYIPELTRKIDVIGLQNFDHAYRRNRGVIAATGHIGNFEILAAFFGQSGYKTAVLGREAYDRRLDQILREARESNRATNVPTTQVKRFISLLKEGYAIGVLIDLDSHRVKSELVESYGRLANTPIGQALIGIKLGCGFVPVVCRRAQDRYALKIFPEIFPRTFSGRPNANILSAVDITWRIRKILDSEVDIDPSQWPWLHNRWHTAPDYNASKPPGLGLYESQNKKNQTPVRII